MEADPSVATLFEASTDFSEAMTRRLTATEVADAGAVLNAWREAHPHRIQLLERIEHDLAAHGHTETAVFRTKAFFCAHTLLTVANETAVSHARDAAERVRAWYSALATAPDQPAIVGYLHAFSLTTADVPNSHRDIDSMLTRLARSAWDVVVVTVHVEPRDGAPRLIYTLLRDGIPAVELGQTFDAARAALQQLIDAAAVRHETIEPDIATPQQHDVHDGAPHHT